MSRRRYPPSLRDDVLRAIQAGMAIAQAARTWGMSEQTVYRWRRLSAAPAPRRANAPEARGAAGG